MERSNSDEPVYNMGNLILSSQNSLSSTGSQMDSGLSAKLARIKYFFASRNSAYDDVWNICQRMSEEMHEQVLDIFVLTL